MDTRPTFKELLDAEIERIEKQDNTLIKEIFDEVNSVLKEKGTRVELAWGTTLYIHANVEIKAYAVGGDIIAQVKSIKELCFSKLKENTFAKKQDFLEFVAKNIAFNYSKLNQQPLAVPTRQ